MFLSAPPSDSLSDALSVQLALKKIRGRGWGWRSYRSAELFYRRERVPLCALKSLGGMGLRDSCLHLGLLRSLVNRALDPALARANAICVCANALGGLCRESPRN